MKKGRREKKHKTANKSEGGMDAVLLLIVFLMTFLKLKILDF